MPKVARFFATTLLILSMSFVTLAEGGNTQGPTITSPCVPLAEGCPTSTAPASSPEQGNSVDIETELALLISLLTQAIL
jgi:hypothetical protein